MPKIPLRLATGVYGIRNLVNCKIYVGSAAVSLEQRFKSHRGSLRAGTHPNEHLQSAWNKYGEKAFEFIILQNCLAGECVEREQYWIDTYKAYDRKLGYNKSPTAGSPLGTKHSPEVRQRYSQAMYKRMEDPEERHKVGNAMRGKKHKPEVRESQRQRSTEMWKDPEIRKKIITANTGKKRTPEQIAKIVAANKGKKRSPEIRARMSAILKGRKQSPETIAKRAASLRGKKRAPEVTARIAAAHRGKKRSEKARANISAAQKKRFQDPIERAKNQLINVGRKKTEEQKRQCSESQMRPEVRKRKSESAKLAWERIRANAQNKGK